MIIDIHAHPVARDLVRDPRNLRLMDREAACLAPTGAIDLLLDRMNRGGIALACLMGPAPGDGIALTNQDVRDAVARHPDRFIRFVGVDPIGHEPQAVRETIRMAVRDWGFRGIGEFANVDLLDARCEAVNPDDVHDGPRTPHGDDYAQPKGLLSGGYSLIVTTTSAMTLKRRSSRP
jgi:hypothetical protein